MSNTIVGTLPINHLVDPNGSLSIDIPLQLPQAKLMPNISIAYHSAANTISAVGLGWEIKGAPFIERVPATMAQDGFKGFVNYDKNDRFALDGQRLIRLTPTGNEYRFEVEQWSKVIALGDDPANPNSWVEYLPDGNKRTFGNTTDSNIKAQGGTATRVWAISEYSDAFSNYVSFAYDNDTNNGSFYLTKTTYGGNRDVKMTHQREVILEYDSRLDTRTQYMGGHKIHVDKKLASITSRVQDKDVHKHRFTYDLAPLTAVSRLRELTLSDPSGATVRPLTFNWTDSLPHLFNEAQVVATIKDVSSNDMIIPLDVSASGRSDIVIASNRLDDNYSDDLYLAVYASNGRGGVSQSPSPGIGFTGLGYPQQLLPLDVKGSGKMDMLHIMSSDAKLTLTVLLSTSQGYKAQKSQSFDMEVTNGRFYSGDFEGTGEVGLVYIYEVLEGNTLRIKFVQFVSRDGQLAMLPPCNGPPDYGLDGTTVVVGDLNGKGAEDIFLISGEFVDSGYVCHIDLIESVHDRRWSTDRKLIYRKDEPLIGVSSRVPWTASTIFLPYAADGDSKTSLLLVSNYNGELEWQLLRSTGATSFELSSRVNTGLPINIDGRGSVTLARTSSTYTVDLINTFDGISGIEVHVLRFDGEKFIPISSVQQPSKVPTGSSVRWADLRGVGRADCTLYTFGGNSDNVTMYSMSSSSSQPVDFISGYENGIGANVLVTYASLSDFETYTTPNDTIKSAVNAMARNIASSAPLTLSANEQLMGHSRTQLVHFPAYVVKTLLTRPHTSQPEALERYTYENARIAFDGRGWLGFETITKYIQPLGTRVKTSYHQEFPLLGQISKVANNEEEGALLQVNDYKWKSVPLNDGKNKSVRLQSCRETFYEAGIHAYDVDLEYQHDSYANITNLNIKSSQPNVLPLSIESTFDNVSDSQLWVIGSKTSEVMKQNDIVLQKTRYVYLPGTHISREVSNWVVGDTWSVQSFEFDQTGNEVTVNGPARFQRKLTYDATYSNIVSVSTFTDNDNELTETATYDLALGKPTSVTNANGHIVSRTYDVLGRVQDVFEGSENAPMEKYSFGLEQGIFFRSSQVKAGSSTSDDLWTTTKSYFDGLQRTWKTERPNPDLSTMICSEVRYDGAGRVVARSRDYFAGSNPVFNTYTYDTRSRVIKEVNLPVAEDVSPVTTVSRYTFESGLAKIIETRSEGKSATDQIIARELLYLPNPQPEPGKLVKPFVVRQIDELGQDIRMLFDGLGRSLSIKDGSDNELSLKWDGLSRQIERSVSRTNGVEKPTFISHFSTEYGDGVGEITLHNNLTGSKTVTKTDFTQRPISKTTPDETLTFTYDKGGKYSMGRLVNVASSRGIEQHFEYDIWGHTTQTRLSLDGYHFITSHEWSSTGQLLSTTNPDGSTFKRSFLADGNSVGKIALTPINQEAAAASITLSGYDNVFLRPQVCEFGNGIKSNSSVASNGSVAHTSMSRGNHVLDQQNWKINAFSQIEKYEVSPTEIQPTYNYFRYDLAGQLVGHISSPTLPEDNAKSETFSYDRSGNIFLKDGKTFVNDGWQLTSIKDPQGATESTFKYSVDGNLIAKLDDKGAETSVMKYDSDSRLVYLDKTTFTYDYRGRLIKSEFPNGDIRIYPSRSYEVTITKSGKKTHTSYLVYGYRRACLTTEEEEEKEPSQKFSPSTVYYFHADHLGSTIAVSNERGEMITRYQYDSFGKCTVSGLDVARYKYSGKEQFGSLYYFGARFYDPDTARFLTLDNYMISLTQITPSTFNMYRFSRNDPINYVDVNGNAPWWHWFFDMVYIVGGLLLSVLPIPIPGISYLGAAILGAGINGLVYDIDTPKDENNGWGWLLQIGLGFAAGLVGAGAGAVVGKAVGSAVSWADAVAARAATTLSRRVADSGRLAARIAVRAGTGAVAGAAGGATTQVITNVIFDRPLDEGVGRAAWIGAISGGLSQGVLEGYSFFKGAGRVQIHDVPTDRAAGWGEAGAVRFRGGSTIELPEMRPLLRTPSGSSYLSGSSTLSGPSTLSGSSTLSRSSTLSGSSTLSWDYSRALGPVPAMYYHISF